MDDIFLDDPRQISAKKNHSRKKSTGRRRRSFKQYLADLFIKGLTAATLVTINFVLFANAGSYSMFNGIQSLNLETAYILAFLAGSAFIITFLLSFSRFLQNIWLTTIATLFLLAIFNQFALFDKGSLLANSQFGKLIPDSLSTYTNYHSHLIIAGLAALGILLFLSISRRSAQFYVLCLLLFIAGWNMTTNYLNPIMPNFRTTYENIYTSDVDTGKKTRRLIYLALPGLTSYTNLKNLADTAQVNNANTPVSQALQNMLGFYTQNKFTLYPNAYSRDPDAFLNLVSNLNPYSEKKPSEHTLDQVLLHGYWNFADIRTPTIYLKKNNLFSKFSKEDYAINVYETNGLEACYTNNALIVNKCVQKENLPFNMDSPALTVLNKTILLFNQWLESTGLVPNINVVNDIMKIALSSQDFPSSDISNEQFSVVNSFKTLDIMARDIENDENSALYFAVINLPGDLYIYDSFCKMKPVSKWISSNSTNAQQKKEAYAEQINCLYGQLESFMQKLKNSDSLKDTTIIIQGLNTPQRMLPLSPTTNFAGSIRSKNVNLAVYNSQETSFGVINAICDTASFTKNALWNAAMCQELDNFNLTDSDKKEALKELTQTGISPQTVSDSLSSFLNWYQKWSEQNNVENNLSNLVVPDQIKETPAVEVKKQPESPKVEELTVESPVISLEKASENSKAEPKSSEPAALKQEAKPEVKAETKTEPKPEVKTETKPISQTNNTEKKDTTPSSEKKTQNSSVEKKTQAKEETNTSNTKVSSPSKGVKTPVNETENKPEEATDNTKISINVKIIDNQQGIEINVPEAYQAREEQGKEQVPALPLEGTLSKDEILKLMRQE